MSLSGEMDRGYITDEYLTCDEYFERIEEKMGEEVCINYKRKKGGSSISTKITPRTDSESGTDIDSEGEMDSINTEITETEHMELCMEKCDECKWEGIVSKCNHCKERIVCGSPECCEMYILEDHSLLVICLKCKNDILRKLKPAKSNDVEYDCLINKLHEYEQMNTKIITENKLIQSQRQTPLPIF